IKNLLLLMGTKIIECGKVGNGQISKLCNNLMLAISMIGTCESLSMALKLGINPKIISNVLNNCSGRSWVSEVYNPIPGIIQNSPPSNDYEPGISVDLITKDLELALSEANELNVDFELARKVCSLYRELSKENGKKDFSVIFKKYQN